MASDERKPVTSSLIPLEIDPASILSLSKGVIFDTIVHNVEYTLNNQRTDPLPWKLIGMSLICDPSRNKKYMQKLQKMQCVPSVICTEIYHSKLIKSESGVLSTPGRKITLATTPHKRLTGIIVCRSIDELLFLESSNTENVHFIQYKLLSYERIATRELVNGPKLSSVRGKVIKTVFDFELTQNNGFPRQLLPVAIVSFGRQDGCDLSLSIRNFLKLDEHKTFDKSYLVTSINVELDRLREEQERKEDAEIENEMASEKIQRRQPLADLSKKSTGTGNAALALAPAPQASLRVPPLTIRLPHSEKPVKSTVAITPVETKFRCSLKLDRVDLSLYNISNLPSSPPLMKSKKSNESPPLPTAVNNKTKPLTLTKPHEHHKPLKRLNTLETKKRASLPAELSKAKRLENSMSTSSLLSDMTMPLLESTTKRVSTSSSSMSPIYRPKTSARKETLEKITTKKKVKRPILPSAYQCSLPLTPIDLSMYDIDLPPMVTSVDPTPMDVESRLTSSSPSSSTSSEPTNGSIEPAKNSDPIKSTSAIETETMHEFEMENVFQVQPPLGTTTHRTRLPIIDELLTPDLNESESHTDNEVFPPATDEPLLTAIDEGRTTPMDETVSEVITEMVTQTMNAVLSTTNDRAPTEATNEVEPTIPHEETAQAASPSSSPQCTAFSPDLPPLDDDPVLFSFESPQAPMTDFPDMMPQDYIIIVPCSDDEDDLDDYSVNNDILSKDTDVKDIESASPAIMNSTCSTLINPSLTRVLGNSSRLMSHRLSTSSSSSCSSISMSILHNQSPRSPLPLTQISLSQKIFNKKQRKPIEPIGFTRYDLCVPIIAQEPLIDPRLIYRLQPITSDPRWPNGCSQCSASPDLPSALTSSTQTILYDRKHPSDFVDPRRESLKNAILYSIYQRIKLLIPNIFIINSNHFQKVLFEQTVFKSNCSLHLEHLLHKLKQSDDTAFFHMIKANEEFQLASFVLQLIFH